jgi:hypothetical protein
VVITADALHTQREHVETLAARGVHWVLTVKGNQPRLRRQLAGLPWRQVEPAHRSAETAHGRREIRTLKVVTIATGIAFPYATQAVQIVRRTRPINARSGRTGRGVPRPSTPSPTWPRTRPARPSSPAGSAGTGRSRTPCTGFGT